MGHRWDRDYNRASRPPPDVIKDAAGYLGEVFILVLGVALLGCLLKFMGLTTDD